MIAIVTDRSSPTTQRTTVAGLAFNFPEQRKQWQHQLAPRDLIKTLIFGFLA